MCGGKAPCGHTAGPAGSAARICPIVVALVLESVSWLGPYLWGPVILLPSLPLRTKAEEIRSPGRLSKEFQNPDQQGSRGPIWKAVLAQAVLLALLVTQPRLLEQYTKLPVWALLSGFPGQTVLNPPDDPRGTIIPMWQIQGLRPRKPGHSAWCMVGTQYTSAGCEQDGQKGI